MYIRPITVHKNGKHHGYWALVESYRTPRGPRQRVVSYLGQAEVSVRCGMWQEASGRPYQRMLFDDTEPAWVEVDARGIRVERCLEFGGPWLGLALFKRLGLIDLFERLIPPGREAVPWPLMAAVLVIARLCDASSELHIAEHFYKDSALCDLLGIGQTHINDDRLYRGLDRLLPHKEAEAAFRIHKSDLKIRPVWHHTNRTGAGAYSGVLPGIRVVENLGSDVQGGRPGR
jgi:hypothetical protein